MDASEMDMKMEMEVPLLPDEEGEVEEDMTSPITTKTSLSRSLQSYIPSTLVASHNPKKHVTTNPILENQHYTAIGSSSPFHIHPAVIHFRMSHINDLDQSHQQYIKVTNVSNVGQRWHLLKTETDEFKVEVKKKGTLAPGMSDTLIVTFTPSTWRYYSDTIRLHTSNSPDNTHISIPIHAYPALPHLHLPRVIDCGTCTLGETRVKTFMIPNEIPVAFEYKITISQATTDFTISPLSGTIPASSSLTITITYRPHRAITSATRITLDVSQMGWEPHPITIMGAAINPEAKIETSLLDNDVLNTTKRALRQAHVTEFSPSKPSSKTKGTSRTRRSTSKTAHEPPPHVIIADTRIPMDLTSHTAIASILLQHPGKRQLSDLKKAITHHQQQMEQQTQAIESSLMSTGDKFDRHMGHIRDYSHKPDVDVEFVGDTIQMKEMIFQRQRNEYQTYEKSIQMNPTKQRIGHVLMTDEQRDAIESARHDHIMQAKAFQRQIDRDTHQNIAESSRVISMVGERPAVEPDWNMMAQDTWQMRKQMLDEFIGCVSTLIIRRRVDSRIAAIKQMLSRSVATTANTTTSTSSFHLTPQQIQPDHLPVAGLTTTQRHPIPLTIDTLPTSFPTYTTFHEIIPYEYRIMGYTTYEGTPIPSYVPLATAWPLRTGISDDTSNRDIPITQVHAVVQPTTTSITSPSPRVSTSRSNTSTTSTSSTTATTTATAAASLSSILTRAMPTFLQQPPPLQPFETLRSDPSIRVYNPPHRFAETDPANVFQPVTFPMARALYLSEVAGHDSFHVLRATPATPTLSSLWQPTQAPHLDVQNPSLRAWRPPPPMYTSQPSQDNLSDTDEDEYIPNLPFKRVQPTREMSASLFNSDEKAGIRAPLVNLASIPASPSDRASKRKDRKGKEKDVVTISNGPTRSLPTTSQLAHASALSLLESRWAEAAHVSTHALSKRLAAYNQHTTNPEMRLSGLVQ